MIARICHHVGLARSLTGRHNRLLKHTWTPPQAMFLKGVELVNAKGDKQLAENALKGKALALYFAAHWCPNCRDFQPALNDFYAKVNATEQQFDIVFVGSDASEEDQVAHFKDHHGAWWMIPYNNELRNDLKRKYGVCAMKEQQAVGVTERKNGIPSLVVVRADGELVDLNGADKVENGEAVIPWTN